MLRQLDSIRGAAGRRREEGLEVQALHDALIPLSSRIIFVCDTFNAMTTDRPYRDAMNEEDALVELRGCAGTQFDPGVVDAFTAEFTALTSARRHVVEDPCALEPAAPGLVRRLMSAGPPTPAIQSYGGRS